MKYEKFKEISAAAENFCTISYTGCNQILEKTNGLIIDCVKNSAYSMHKNSEYIVYTHSINLGTKKYPHIIKCVCVERLDRLKETPQCYTGNGIRIPKKSIIGYLSN